MRNIERTRILHNLVLTGQAKVIQAVLDCKGDRVKEDIVLKDYIKKDVDFEKTIAGLQDVLGEKEDV